MAILTDIVVKRADGAAVSEVNLVGALKIAVVGRSRGKNTADTSTFSKASGSDDLFSGFSSIEDNVRSVSNVTHGADADLETFYPNVHFTVNNGSTILAYNNLADDGDSPDSLKLDWSNAPKLVAPSVDTAVVASSGGSIVDKSYYEYVLTAFDSNDRETTKGAIEKVTFDTGVDTNKCTLSWKKVEHASAYGLYRRPSGSDVWTDSRVHKITSGSTVYYEDTKVDGDLGSYTPPTVNNTIVEPVYTETCTMNYEYGKVTYESAKELTSYEEVLEEHGVGSELTNLGKIVLDKTYNNAPVMVTVVPKDTSWSAYLNCLTVLEAQDCQIVSLLHCSGVNGIGSTNMTSLINNWKLVYNHAASVSDPSSGQKERYALFGLPYGSGRSIRDYKTFIDGFTGTATKGKRGIVVMPDGLKARPLSWIETDGDSTTDTATIDAYMVDPDSNDLSGLFFAIATIARHAGLRDLAEPLTEKDIIGFSLPNNPFTDTQIKSTRNYGCLVVENDTGTYVVSRYCNMSLAGLSLEDGELSIALVEDYIRKDLRRRLKKYRGKKMLPNILKAAKRTIINALSWYVQSNLISYYDSGSVIARQDTTQDDRIYGYFIYTPVFPVNEVWVTYNFTS